MSTEDLSGGPYLITCGLIANAYHDELGRGGYFHPASGTSEGQLIFIYACYLAYEQLRGRTDTEGIDAADVYARLASMMLDGMGDGSLTGPMLRQPIPEAETTITLMHWLFAAKGDVTLQQTVLDYQAASVSRVLVIPSTAHGGDVFRVWQVYPAERTLLYSSPFSPVVGGGGITISDTDWSIVGGQARITLPPGAADGAYKIVYGYNGAGVIPRGEAYEAYPAWTAIPDGYSACAPDTFRWFEQAIGKAIEHDTRDGNSAKWEKLRNAMRRTALRGQNISDLREVFKPQTGIRVFNIDGIYCFASRPDSRPAPSPLPQGWLGYSYWSRDNDTGDIIGTIPEATGGEAQLGRGFEDGWRVKTTYQEADHYLYLQIGVDHAPQAGDSFRVYVSSTREYVADQRWYCDIASLPGFVPDGIVREYLIPRSLLINNEGSGTVLPAGTVLLNYGVTSSIKKAHTLRLRRMRFVGGESAAWVNANLDAAVAGSPMPYFPGAMPFAINADTVAQQFIGYNGNPFHGYQLPDFWLDCAAQAAAVFPGLTPASLPIPDASGALTYPLSASTAGGVSKPAHILLMEQQLRFLTDAQAKYHSDIGILGPFAHTFVLNTPARANIGNPQPHTWVYTNDDPNTRWVGYQVRIVESLAVLVHRTSGDPVAADARAVALAQAVVWLRWLDAAWPGLSGAPYRGMPTDFDGAGSPQTLYEEVHAPAIVLRACLYLRMSNVDTDTQALCSTIMQRCWSYMELFWQTNGPMRFTWSPEPSQKLWYGFWHGEIITSIALMLANPTLVPPAIGTITPAARLVQTSQWLVKTATYFCGDNLPPNLPVFTAKADWSNGVTESLEWLTDVKTSTAGAEQRRALRTSPRRTYEASVVVEGAERTRLDMAVRAAGSAEWLAPIWPDVLVTTVAAREGSLRITADTLWRDFVQGGSILVRSPNGETATLKTTDIEPGAIRLALPLAAPWPAGSRVIPLRRSRFTDQPQFSRKNDRISVAQVRFRVSETNDFNGLANPLEHGVQYLGYGVIERKPDQTSDTDLTYERITETLDNSTGVPSIVDTAQRSFGGQTHQWILHGREDHAVFRTLLYALHGRLKAAWLPTFSSDFDLVQGAVASSRVLQVRNCGYSEFGGPSLQGRRDIQIVLRGVVDPIYRRIESSAVINNNVERITLASALGRDIPLDSVVRISFITLSRLASDTIQLQHETAADGIATVAAVFRNTYEERFVVPY